MTVETENESETPTHEGPNTERPPEGETTGEHEAHGIEHEIRAEGAEEALEEAPANGGEEAEREAHEANAHEASAEATEESLSDETPPGDDLELDIASVDPEATVNLTGIDIDATVNLAGSGDALLAEGASADVARTHLKGLLESLIFVSDKPIKPNELAKTASAQAKQVKELLAELKAEYAPRGIQLDEVAGGWVFRTNAQYAPFVRDLTKQKPIKLTRAQIETLSILAYRQPITRPEIDDIRGVDSGPVLKMLLERDLVRILGKKDEPGRPILYGTTAEFLEFFSLKSLKDLPTLREFSDLTEESRRVVERELGETLEGTAGVSIDETGTGAAAAAVEGAAGDTLPPSAYEDDERASVTDAPPAPPTGEELDEGLATSEPAEAAFEDEAETTASEAEPEAALGGEDEGDDDDEPHESESDDAADAEEGEGEATPAERPVNADDEAEFPDDDDDEFDDDDDDDEEDEDEEDGDDD